MKKTAFILISAVILLGSCTLWEKDETGLDMPNNSEIELFQKIFMSSYYAERGGAPAGARALTPFLEVRSESGSRATVPVAKLTDATFASLGTIDGEYPEPGQTTSFTAIKVAGTAGSIAVYDVTATTTYASTDIRNNYVEEYYVLDLGKGGTEFFSPDTPDGEWTTDDPIVKPLGTIPADGYSQDQKHRIRQILTFDDRTTRTETIVDASTAGGPRFDPAPFAIDGSLDLSQAFVPVVVGGTDDSVPYSSVVMYRVTPVTNPNFWFWQGSDSQEILGIRYYTEAIDTLAGTYTTRSVSFEKTLSDYTTTGGDFAGTVQDVFVGSVHTALAESVVRQQVVYDLAGDGTAIPYAPSGTGTITTNMRTRVVNVAGLRDFILAQLDSDAVSLSLADSTIHTPTAGAEEIIAGDPAAFTFLRNQQLVSATASGTIPFAVTVTTLDSAGLGALATIYTSVLTGTASSTVPTAPVSNLLATNTVGTFTGKKSTETPAIQVPGTVGDGMHVRGTAEAWIYIDQKTKNAGIIHQGIAVDQSDEGFSLQGWGNNGQIAIILNKTAGGTNYDAVYSNVNLKPKIWYHIAATWDTAPTSGSPFIKLYINGNFTSLGGTGAPSATAYYASTSPIVVGSLFPAGTQTATGYFSLDGKITGTNVSATVLSDAEVVEKYNASKDDTGNW